MHFYIKYKNCQIIVDFFLFTSVFSKSSTNEVFCNGCFPTAVEEIHRGTAKRMILLSKKTQGMLI